METMYQLLGLLGAGLIVWVMYRGIKANPHVFTKQNMHKSFTSMGILALLLIVFIGLLITLLNAT
ncbi:MAG: hypothetical protein ACOVQX_06290 [Legionella sp.]